MRKAGLLVAAATLAAIVGYGLYLGRRVADARRSASQAVAAILATADPADLALPARRIDQLVRVEDPTFWTNDGIDLSTPGAGATTIAQGLGKRIFFKRFSPGLLKLGKIELMALTRLALVPAVSKHDILTAAVSVAYLGSDRAGAINGFAQGGRRWFGKEPEAITDDEFLALVAMLPAPNALHPGTEASAERVRRIKRYLAGECAPRRVDDIYYEACAR